MLWSSVEAELGEAIAALGDPLSTNKPHGIGRSLARWKDLHVHSAQNRADHLRVVNALHDQLAEALRIRNSIAHGLKGYGVAASDGSSEAHFECRLNNGPEIITLRHLRVCLGRLARAGSHISRLTYAVSRPDEPGLQSLYDDVLDLMHKR
ncbi:hypothetical protein jaqu_26630 [Jannaschia aquimarina]|uniref:Uncharacterized protein n=1 Tax=Jannaschia aquimarina TaxID=935700 RepID=A0A0D1EFA1_9RHOB|nr:hypothetical protein jaqu_26630 [Jannaschia aquimarina]